MTWQGKSGEELTGWDFDARFATLPVWQCDVIDVKPDWNLGELVGLTTSPQPSLPMHRPATYAEK